MIKEYKKQFKYFLTNKKYIIPVLFVAILSYGFAITHYSIGVDDLCFDKYVTGTYILSAGRWGTWALYNLLHIVEFTPFWLDFIVASFMVIISIVLSAFIRNQMGDKINIWGYVLFSSLLISNPLINQFYIYQSTNLSIVVSNLIVIVCGIILFEKFFNDTVNKKTILLIGIIMSIPISMYESCAQTYLVFIFVSIFIKSLQGFKDKKNLLKFFLWSIAILVIGIILYFIIGKIILLILTSMGLKTDEFASKAIPWINKKFIEEPLSNKITIFKHYTIDKFINGLENYFPVMIFAIFSLIGIITEIIIAGKRNKALRLCLFIVGICSNFLLIPLTINILYRVQFSWVITTAFLGLYIYCIFEQKKYLKYVINIVIIFIILQQTKCLNQLFYNDYKRFEYEKTVANEIALNVIEIADYEEKPLIYILSDNLNYNKFELNDDNSQSLIIWGQNAFGQEGNEITKFINNFGYSFKYATLEEKEAAEEQYEKLDEETKSKNIIELENYIVVNLDKY